MPSLGLHKLSRPATIRLSQNCCRKIGRRLTRGPRPRYLALACRLLRDAVRISKRMAKRDPHLFGPHARAYYDDTVGLENFQREFDEALRKVYGPNPDDASPRQSTIWTDRYINRPTQRSFRKWFKESYACRSNG